MTSPFEQDEELEGHELRSVGLEGLSQDEIDDKARAQSLVEYAHYSRIILPEGATKADAMYILSKEIPENEFGLPAFFYRVDMLPYNLEGLTQEDADACVVELSYDEGYPTYNGGHIFWQQLPSEPFDAFMLFQRYIDQAQSLGLRQTQILAMENRVSLEKVVALYHEYFWAARAKSHDLFQVAADRKRRELRGRSLENKHFEMADSLLLQLKNKLADGAEDGVDIFKDLTGKEFLECMRLLMNMQRVSAGLPQNGNAGGVPFNPDSAMTGKQLLEDITKGVQRGDAGLGLGGGLAEMLKDPNFALEAQSVVLRVRQYNDPNAQIKVTPLDE